MNFKKIIESQKQLFFPTSGRKVSFFVLCGLPGVGKTTLANEIKSCYFENDAIILSRDEIRVDILWEMRKDEPEKQKETTLYLDDQVSEKMISKIHECVDQDKYYGIIIDGCYTNWKDLLWLLLEINNFKNDPIINLLIIGNENSKCHYLISDKKEGDYSDYNEDGTHKTIPFCVLQRKRKELKDLLEKRIDSLYNHIDFIVFLDQILL